MTTNSIFTLARNSKSRAFRLHALKNNDSNKLSSGGDPVESIDETNLDEETYKKGTVFQQEKAISSIQLKFISPQKQLRQLYRILPNESIVGQVLNSQTLNYKTLKPERDGLFCERIFGPTQDYVCSCGKRQKSKDIQYCPDCEVEYTSSRARRYRLGFIRLGVPVAHIWCLKGRPSYIALLLDMKKKHAESIAYGATCIYNNYSPEFGLRIQKTRREFNERFSDLREEGKVRPGYMNLEKYGYGFEQIKKFAFVDKKADDFWVHSRSIWDFFRTDWRKTDFYRKKPFFQMPLMRDHYNFICRLYPDNLFHVQDYLFSFRRSYGSTPINKYAKAIPNSMICYPEAREIEVLLTGGLAFYHLFSKIDCHRMQAGLGFDLMWVRDQIVRFHILRRARLRRTRNRNLTKDEIKEYRMLCQRLSKLSRRIKLIRTFWRTGSRPEWMFVSVIPILPPDLRPIIQMGNGQLAVSDLNRLYQNLFHRNRNMKSIIINICVLLGFDIQELEDGALDFPYHTFQGFRFSTNVMCFQQALLQKAVDALFENSKGGADIACGSNKRPLKSLSDILKGKKGRFRQNLLGKRVDYSGRSVIVVGPKLKLHQCGLPKELALELFQSVLIRRLQKLELVKTIVAAKQLIRAQHPIIWPILNEVMADFPVLLNRAPTLHRLGVQAFIPKLVRGKAILLHPLVCPAFNADFDGDQMGVHLPLSIEARSEAWSLMLATQNILSPATGDPILTPSQDMVLGCYYLTTLNPRKPQKQKLYFSNLNDVAKAYFANELHAHDLIWLSWKTRHYSNQLGKKLLEIRFRYSKPNQFSEKMVIASTIHQSYNLAHQFGEGQGDFDFCAHFQLKDKFIRTTVGRVLMNLEYQQKLHKSTVAYSN